MKVYELISRLRGLPQAAEVEVEAWNDGGMGTLIYRAADVYVSEADGAVVVTCAEDPADRNG